MSIFKYLNIICTNAYSASIEKGSEFHLFAWNISVFGQSNFFLSICCRYDVGCDGFLDLTEMKIMMEKLGAPQTHIGLKGMIAEVDEDNDGKISFREFMLIYR